MIPPWEPGPAIIHVAALSAGCLREGAGGMLGIEGQPLHLARAGGPRAPGITAGSTVPSLRNKA